MGTYVSRNFFLTTEFGCTYVRRMYCEIFVRVILTGRPNYPQNSDDGICDGFSAWCFTMSPYSAPHMFIVTQQNKIWNCYPNDIGDSHQRYFYKIFIFLRVLQSRTLAHHEIHSRKRSIDSGCTPSIATHVLYS